MPSLLLSATESAPHVTGSNRAPIDKPALHLSALSSSTYPVHDDRPEPIPSDVNVKASVLHVNMTQFTARRMHNALQPISRLNSDVLEQFFLTGAFLAASHRSPPSSSSSSPTTSSHYSLTRTILTYAHLTSALRQTALRSARLWALLLDFERGSSEWNIELLRRSTGVSLQLVWQWSKAAAGAGSVSHVRSRSESSRGRINIEEWGWDGGDHAVARRREDRAKRARLEKVLQREVLERARSLGFAVPAPYFASVLLERLGTSGGVLPELESLRIVKSRPRRDSITQGEEDEHEETDKDGKETHVPLGVIANAPRLRRLAIAESNLAFHELLSFSSSPPLSQSIPPDIALILRSASTNTLLPPPAPNALHVLSHLQALHIADLPLRTAPTAREWLRYLTFMPALEELVLEGAVLRRVDLTLRDNLKAGSGSRSDGDGNPGPISASRNLQGERQDIRGDREGNGKGIEDETIEWSALPKLRVLTLDAALEDVAVFAATLPLPSPSRIPLGGRQMKWTLLCADADTGDMDDVERVVNLFAGAVGGDGRGGPSEADASVSEEGSAGLSLSVRATDRDVYVHLSATGQPTLGDMLSPLHVDGADLDGLDPDPEADLSIYVNLHSMGGSGGAGSFPLVPNRLSADVIDMRPTITSTSSTLSPVLTALAHGVLPQVAALELELPLVASPSIHSAALNEVLRHARAVEVLTLGPKAAKGVLRMLQGEQHKRSLSIDSQSSFWSSSSSGLDSVPCPTSPIEEVAESSDADATLLSSLQIIHLRVESASGPTWTALLRFAKARMARGLPIQRVVFNDSDAEDDRPQAQFVRTTAARIPEGRVRELEGMGVDVVVNER